jgi:hypothetical protein
MPKFVLKQINERRLLNSTTLNSIANNSMISNQALISPFYTKSTSDMIENANKELLLARRNSNNSKANAGNNPANAKAPGDSQSMKSQQTTNTLTSYNINNLTMPHNIGNSNANNPNLQNLFNQSQFTSTSTRPVKYGSKKS